MVDIKSIILILLLAAFGNEKAHAASVTPVLVANGNNHFTCDGTNTIRFTYPVNADVVRTYIFVLTQAVAIDVVAVDSASDGGAVADAHNLIPYGALGGWRASEADRSFEPDSVHVGTVDIWASCGGGGITYVYFLVFTRSTP